MTDLRQSPRYAKYMQSIGWNTQQIDNIYIYIKNVFLLGKVIKIQRVDMSAVTLNKTINKFSPFQIIYEPLSKDGILKDTKLSHSAYLPTKTLQIDLTKSEKKLLSGMHQKNRYNTKVAQKNGLVVTETNDIKTFSEFWSTTREGKSAIVFSQKKNIEALYKAFEEHSSLVVVLKNKQIVSGILMVISENVAYYMYAASNNTGKKLHAPTLAVWEAMKIAKKRSCKTFDFEGLYDERFPIKSWLGFSKFKKTFGGQEIVYPGCFTKTDILSFLKR